MPIIYLLRDMQLLQSNSVSNYIHPSVRSPLKRTIDIVGALVGLTILAVVWVPIAIAIKCDSPGPLLYSQIRCGLSGEPFLMWKFRSMVVGADALKANVRNEASGHIFKNRNDPRVTRAGKFLRRASLDELPQFWNVLRGEMSLVGTRPPTPDEVAQYTPYHWKRLCVKPGITGEWQVNGRSCVDNFDAIVKMDLSYQRRWSVWYDLTLIVRTIWVVLGKRGAY